MTTDPPPADAAGHAAIVRQMLDPAFYPDSPRAVEHVETHISQVFLTDRFVYKLKKPVRFDFLDFSTLERREAACREELRLNRRMAADVYLDVLPIVADPAGVRRLGEPHSGNAGRTVDWVVHMKRLPAERMLDRLIAEKQLDQPAIDRLARFLARHYAEAPALAVDGAEYRSAIAHHVADNRRVLLAAPDVDLNRVRRIHTAQLRYLASRADVFAARARQGRVIDGHGDLRPEHVCLVEPPAVFDCIEFSAEFRRVDILDELCFLAMECDVAGARAIGRRVLDAYRAETHDDFPPELALFYTIYRATVRAKVAELRAEQLTGPPRQAASQVRDRYLAQAEAYLAGGGSRPLLMLVTGLTGTGKSTLARALGESLGIDVLRTDVVRDAVVAGSERAEAFGEGRYATDARGRVYDELLRQARELLSHGVSVILDGTFTQARKRAQAFELGRELKADTLLIRCVCPRETAIERIEARRRSNAGDPSESRPELYDRMAEEEAREGVAADALVIDTTTPGEEQVARVNEALPPVYPTA